MSIEQTEIASNAVGLLFDGAGALVATRLAARRGIGVFVADIA